VTPGALSIVAELPLEDGPSGARAVREAGAGRDAAGKYYVVFMNAVVRTTGATHPEVSFGGEERIWVTDAQSMPGGAHLLAYSTALGTEQINGVIVYDERDPSSFRKIAVAGTFSGIAPLSRSRVALLSSGVVRVLDLDSGELLPAIGHVPGEEFLAAG
jgi:hypothetical protein